LREVTRGGSLQTRLRVYWETTWGWSGSLPRRDGERLAGRLSFPSTSGDGGSSRVRSRWHYVGVKDSEGWAEVSVEIYRVICVYVTRLRAATPWQIARHAAQSVFLLPRISAIDRN